MSEAPATHLSLVEDNVRRNVKIFMALRGLRGPAVCRALHMSKQTLSQRLTGASRFTVDEISQLGPLLDVTFEVLASNPDGVVRSRWHSPESASGQGSGAA